MAKLPDAPNPKDFEQTLEVITKDVEAYAEVTVPLNAKLTGMVAIDNGMTRLIFVSGGESEAYNAAVAEYNEVVSEAIQQATADGVTIYTLEDLQKYLDGELTADAEVEDPTNILSLFGDTEDDNE